jgi:hypothetical protein
MEQISFSEYNTCSCSHVILILLWDPKFHSRLDKNPPIVSILTQMNPGYTLKPHFFKTHLNITL